MSKRLEEIRDTAISGQYADALAELEEIIGGRPVHVEALRLKGNILELKALNRAQHHAQKLLRSRDYVNARKCYEEILALEPDNTLALIDLGDHFRNLGASTKALDYYERAISLLSKGRFSWSRKEEIEEAFEHAAGLYTELGREADGARIEELRRNLTRQIRARQARRRSVQRRSVQRR
ncbi:MAG: tetratricopeptide repeat protein [Gammaproteobacteria bacterium]